MPKLLLLAGIGWSATTPLWKTLKNQKIVNTGIVKEPELLSYLENSDEQFWRYIISTKRNMLHKYCPAHKWGNADLLFSKNATLDNYIEYYEKLASDEYQYVGDFSNPNALLSDEFLSKIAPKLKDHFDVKVIYIARDPVRRHYSMTSATYRSKSQTNPDIGEEWTNHDPKSRFEWMMIKKRFPDSISYWKHQLLSESRSLTFSYVNIYKKFSQYFPTHPIVMEDLWSGKTKNLEEFLECKLNGLYRNCYYPEMGTKAPRYEDLRDQWMSDLQDLTDEDYNYGKRYLQWIYDEWYDQFQTRPWD